MTDAERRHLAAFVAIADAGSITAAAARLHMSQPALSRALGQLEAIVGQQLVDRSTHHLVLTAAGQRFLQPARAALDAFDQAIGIARAGTRPLRFGHSWATTDRAAEILQHWSRLPDKPPLELVYSEERLAGVDSGQCDVALARGPVDQPGLIAMTIADERRYAAIPRRHHLSSRRIVRLADLTGETLVLHAVGGTTTIDLWPTARRPSTFIEVDSTEHWLTTIGSGQGVGVTVESIAASRPHSGIVYRPIDDADPVHLQIIRPRRPTHPDTKRFVATARSVGRR